MKVSLDRFEGPLDLLLALIRKNEVSIEDLPVAEITRQFLDYMRRASALDINLGAEFALTAATLIQIKTRSLLPSDPALAGAGQADPKQELIRELLDYDKVRRAAAFLQARLTVAGSAWSRGDSEPVPVATEPESGAGGGRALNVLDVLALTRTALSVARQHREGAGLRERLLGGAVAEVPISRMMAYLERVCSERRLPVLAERLFGEQATVGESVVLFLAMLEMCRAGGLGLEQAEPFGPVLVTAQ